MKKVILLALVASSIVNLTFGQIYEKRIIVDTIKLNPLTALPTHPTRGIKFTDYLNDIWLTDSSLTHRRVLTDIDANDYITSSGKIGGQTINQGLTINGGLFIPSSQYGAIPFLGSGGTWNLLSSSPKFAYQNETVSIWGRSEVTDRNMTSISPSTLHNEVYLEVNNKGTLYNKYSGFNLLSDVDNSYLEQWKFQTSNGIGVQSKTKFGYINGMDGFGWSGYAGTQFRSDIIRWIPGTDIAIGSPSAVDALPIKLYVNSGLKMTVGIISIAVTVPITSSVTNGAPFSVASQIKVANLNVDLLNGKHDTDFATATHNHTGTYLTSEVDPIFTAWDKTTGISITESQISDLRSYSLDSHNHTGTYLTSEVDPIFTPWLAKDPVSDLTRLLGSAAYARLSDFASAAHDHAGIYLTSEVDPIFTAWNKSTGISITESQISDLRSYSLNSHNHTGIYLTSEVDPIFTVWNKSTGISITESQISDLRSYSLDSHNHTGTYLTSEVDPIFTPWLAKDPVSDLTRLLGSAAYARLSDFASASHDHAGIYLTSETDPIFSAWNKSTGISITESQISDLRSYSLDSHNHTGIYLTSEVDPIFTPWLAADPIRDFALLAGSAAYADLSAFATKRQGDSTDIPRLPVFGGRLSGDLALNTNKKVVFGNGGEGYIKWNDGMVYYSSGNYHSFFDADNHQQFGTTPTGVNIPTGKTYQVNDVSIISPYITDGVTTRSPNEDAVFGALALKADKPGVQALTGTTSRTYDVSAGLHATMTIGANTTVTLSNLVAGMSGNLTITNPATAYTITLAGYTNKISPSIRSAANQMICSGGTTTDIYSWYYDGNILAWAGTKNLN